MKHIAIFDSTLRDGAQGEGLSFSVADKLKIVSLLDELGVAYIEAGNPGSNPKDLEFFSHLGNIKLKNAKLVAFGATCRSGIAPEEDASLCSLADAGTDVVAIFGKSWDFQATAILHVSLEENLAIIAKSIAFLKSRGKKVFFDAEHFFDGYKENREYALSCLSAATASGADALVLCETRGGVLPHEVYETTKAVVAAFPGIEIAIHAHNDSDTAVASSLEAVRAGAVQVQGTLLGFGERCGNAKLSSIIADLELKMGMKAISGELASLVRICRSIASVANVNIPSGDSYIGASAFAHKGGMHIDGVLKNSASFEHIEPSQVGATRRLLMSEVAGRSLLLGRMRRYVPTLQKDSAEAKEILSLLKEKEAVGYQYEGAEQSFELLVRRHLGSFAPFFELVHYQTIGQHPFADIASGITHTAVVKVRVGERSAITAGEGKGPVDALDKALRRVLEGFYPTLKEAYLTDYKVRVLDGGSATASTVRVVIDSTDGVHAWSTVGVSADIIEASWLALCDSIEYKLILDGVVPKEE